MAETNFKIFNEANTADKTFNDSEYTNATQRQNGVTPGMAISRLHNKLYLQVSAMAKAVADFIVSQGHDCYDNNVSEITTNLQAAITNVAGNNISDHNTDDAAHENRFSLFQKISTLGDDIVKKLALTTTITVITALQTNSWFGQLLKMVLNASGVKYAMAQNGYICFGSFFGGLIIQWGKYSTTTTGYDDISYPIAFTDAVFSVIPVDWDTSNITVSRGYTFTVLENDTTLSKCRITSGTGGAGLIRVAFIGR